MSRLLYFDPFSGLAGDMVVGALLSVGAPWEVVKEAVNTMNVPNLTVSREMVKRGDVQGTRFAVQWISEGPPVHRHLGEILDRVEHAALTPEAARRATLTFKTLAEAEASIHAMSVEAVHLHEVGAEDSIADVVGACAALDALEIDDCLVGPIATGRGWTVGAHGPLPVPAPATTALLRGFVIDQGTVTSELTTPTGAALMRGFEARTVVGVPRGELLETGYGAGTRNHEHPNLLRVFLIDTDPKISGGWQ